MEGPQIKEFQINDEALKNIENDIYEINTKVGIKINMKSNRMVEDIVIPLDVLKDEELEKKLVDAFNEASELVSNQVSEDIFRLLLQRGIIPNIYKGSNNYE
ncbi:TPA: hypothetical protein GXZ54_05750 [bacterium]|jgi:DNA-binding protein YbaB|nr:hypothetical protein [bacterium]